MSFNIFRRLRSVFKTFTAYLKKLTAYFERERRFRIERTHLNIDQGKHFPGLRQWRYIGLVLSSKEKKTISVLLLVISLAISILGAGWYLANRVFIADYGGTYIEGVVGNPRLINPLYAVASDIDSDLVSLIYSGLFKIDSTGEAVPDLAEALTIKDNGKKIIITLKSNAKFGSGEPLRARDVVFTYELIKNPKYQSPLRSYFLNLDFKALDERNVEITLNETKTKLKRYLTQGILPEYIWENVPSTSATLAEYNLKPIGSGPYRFKSLTKDKQGVVQSYTLVSSEHYYGERPYLKEVNFKFYSDYEKVKSALESKEINGAAFLPQALAKDFMNRAAWRAHRLILPQYVALFFNPLKQELLKNQKVREALFLALDREMIQKTAVGNNGQVVNGPLSGSLLRPAPVTIEPANLTKAQELISSLGFQLIDGHFFKVEKPKTKKAEPTKTPITITLTTIDLTDYKLAAEKIKEMWSALGLEVNLKIIAPDAPERKDIFANRDFEILLFGELLGFDFDPTPFWHSQGLGEKGLNLSGLSNSEVDRLLEAAAQTDSLEIKKEKYTAFQNILDRDRVAIFLWSPYYQYFVDSRIKGVDVSYMSTPSDRLHSLPLWYQKTRRAFRKK